MLPSPRPSFAVLTCLAAFLSTGCATLSLCPAEGGQPWHEVWTDHLHILTNLDPTEAQEAAVRFERVRHAILGVLPVETHGKLPVILPYKDVFGWGRPGKFSHRGSPVVAVVSRGIGPFAREDRGETFAHEFSHYLSASALRSPPRWINEGLAQFFDQVRLEKDGLSATIGRPNRDALEFVREEGILVTLETLWEWDHHPVKGSAEYSRYASSWFWVSFLTRLHGERFTAFLERIAKGQPARAAWDELFPASEAGSLLLQAHLEFRKWFADWPERRVELPASCGANLVVRQLSAAGYHVVAARAVAAGLSEQTATADSLERGERVALEYQQALYHDPRALVPRLAALCSAPQDRRLELARQLASEHPDSAVARLALAAQIHASFGDGDEYRDQLAAGAARLRKDGFFWEALASLSMRSPEHARRLAQAVLADPVPAELASDPALREALQDPGLRLMRLGTVGACL